jgi:hypothetical protein
MKLVHDFNGAKLILKRLNYGVITLVPTIKDANNIPSKYMSICLLNVDCMVFPKLLIEVPRDGERRPSAHPDVVPHPPPPPIVGVPALPPP